MTPRRLRSPGRITAQAMGPLVAAVQAAGGGPGLWRGAGVDPETFRRPGGRWLPALLTDRLWEAAVAAGRPDMPLQIAAAAVAPSSFGLLTYLLASSDTVGSALQSLARHYGVLSEATSYRLEPDRRGLLVAIDLHGPRPPSVESFAAAISLCFVRHQALGPVAVREVRLTQPRPDEGLAAAHERTLGAPVRFASDATGYVLDRSSLAVPLRGADPVLRGLLEQLADRQLASPSAPALAERVRDQIAVRGVGCSVRAADVAADLGVSERTLRRTLLAEGTSFQAQLDEALAAAALERLDHESVEQVAAALGFADAATFRRAFRRWRGVSPRSLVGRPRSPR